MKYLEKVDKFFCNIKYSITIKMALYLLLISVVPLTTVGYISFLTTNSLINSEVRSLSTQIMSDKKQYLEIVAKEIEGLIANISGVDDIKNALQGQYDSEDDYNKLSTQAKIGYILSNYKNINGLISIDIYAINGNHYHVGDTLNIEEIDNSLKARLTEEAKNANGNIYWAGIEDNININSASKKVVTAVKLIKSLDNNYLTETVLGILVINYDIKTLNNLINMNNIYGINFTIVDNKGRIVCDNNIDKIGEKANEHFVATVNAGRGNFKWSTDGQDYLVNYERSDYTNWLLFSSYSQNRITEKINIIGKVTNIVFLICFVLVGVIAYLFSKNFVLPVKKVANLFVQIENGDVDIKTRLPVKSKDEIGELNIGFNKFAETLEEVSQKKEDLFIEKELFKTTLLSVGDGVISTDTNGNILVMNKVSENLTGWTQEEAIGKPIEEVFNIINEFTREKTENPAYKVLGTGKTIELANHTILVSKDGIERPIEDSAAPINDEYGNITGVVLVFRDFTDKKQKQKEIEYLSYHDQLTGLFNRRYYEQEIVRMDDEKYYPLTLIMLDVNGLKLTNDAFGHMTGDLILQKISSVLKKECRENDIISRIGGDEFIILLPNTDAKNAEVIIDRINTTIKNEKIDNVILSISVGFAIKQEKSESITEVFMKAEDNMYRNKLVESNSVRSNTIDLIMNTLFEKNDREMLHSERVGYLSAAIAENMIFTNNEINEIKLAGQMHDIGKIGISEAVLNNPKKLNYEEHQEIKRHSEIGYRILSSVNELSQISNYVLEHHERFDGSGYPKGIKGDEISLQARIITIADAYDAMTKERTYRKALSKEEAIAELKKCSGTQFDSDIVNIFVEKVLKNESDFSKG